MGIKIYRCSEWGAAPPRATFDRTHPTYIVVHHTAGTNRSLLTDSEKAKSFAFKLARDIQHGHMNNSTDPWSDSGQNFLVTRDGIILESRHGSYQAILDGQSIRAAHAGNNTANTNPGIECEGLYTNSKMPDKQWKALVDLCAFISIKCKMQAKDIFGHREFTATACPGDWLFANLPRLRDDVRAKKLEWMKKT